MFNYKGLCLLGEMTGSGYKAGNEQDDPWNSLAHQMARKLSDTTWDVSKRLGINLKR